MKLTLPTGKFSRRICYITNREEAKKLQPGESCEFAIWYYGMLDNIRKKGRKSSHSNNLETVCSEINDHYSMLRKEIDRAILNRLIETQGVVDSFPCSDTFLTFSEQVNGSTKSFRFDYFNGNYYVRKGKLAIFGDGAPVYRCTDIEMPHSPEYEEEERKVKRIGRIQNTAAVPQKRSKIKPVIGLILSILVAVLFLSVLGLCAGDNFGWLELDSLYTTMKPLAYENGLYILPWLVVMLSAFLSILLQLHNAVFWIGMVVLAVAGLIGVFYIADTFDCAFSAAARRKNKEYDENRRQIIENNKKIREDNKKASAAVEAYKASQEHKLVLRRDEAYRKELQQMHEQFHKAWYDVQYRTWEILKANWDD